MYKFRKFLSVMLLMTMVASIGLTGCSPKEEVPAPAPATEESGETPAEPAMEKAEVDIFQFKVEIASDLEDAAADYMKTHPNVKVNIQTVGGGDDYGAALKAKFQSGSEPDIYNVGGPQDVEDWMAKLEDLSGEPWVDQALDGILSGATVDGKVYALPFNIEGYGFVYNKNIFADAGIDAMAIKDFASLEEAVMTLDKKIKAGELEDKYPLLEAVFDYPAKETWVTGLHASNAAISQELTSSLDAFAAKDFEFKYNDAYKAIIDLQADYSPSSMKKGNLNAVDYATQVDEGLAIERVAIIQQGNWVYGGVNVIDENVAANIGFLPFPVKGVVEDSIPVGVPMHWAVNSGSSDADKAAAKDFLNWLYTSNQGKDYIVNKFFFIPPLKGYEGFEPKDPLGQDIMRFANEGKTMPWVFMGYPTGWGMEILGTEIQKYLAGDVTWDELVDTSVAKWAELRQ